jgi:hypothetical protein
LFGLPFPNFSHFFTQYSGIHFSGKKEIFSQHRIEKDVKHCGQLVEDVMVVGVTREIVQPAKASNFSENRLLKRASPHDTETIYQLFIIANVLLLICLRMLVLVK